VGVPVPDISYKWSSRVLSFVADLFNVFMAHPCNGIDQGIIIIYSGIFIK
jgi:hypothetical protein